MGIGSLNKLHSILSIYVNKFRGVSNQISVALILPLIELMLILSIDQLYTRLGLSFSVYGICMFSLLNTAR